MSIIIGFVAFWLIAVGIGQIRTWTYSPELEEYQVNPAKSEHPAFQRTPRFALLCKVFGLL